MFYSSPKQLELRSVRRGLTGNGGDAVGKRFNHTDLLCAIVSRAAVKVLPGMLSTTLLSTSGTREKFKWVNSKSLEHYNKTAIWYHAEIVAGQLWWILIEKLQRPQKRKKESIKVQLSKNLWRRSLTKEKSTHKDLIYWNAWYVSPVGGCRMENG